MIGYGAIARISWLCVFGGWTFPESIWLSAPATDVLIFPCSRDTGCRAFGVKTSSEILRAKDGRLWLVSTSFCDPVSGDTLPLNGGVGSCGSGGTTTISCCFVVGRLSNICASVDRRFAFSSFVALTISGPVVNGTSSLGGTSAYPSSGSTRGYDGCQVRDKGRVRALGLTDSCDNGEDVSGETVCERIKLSGTTVADGKYPALTGLVDNFCAESR